MEPKTKVDKLKDAYVVQTVDEFFNYDKDASMQMLERIVFRNIMYYMGEQWFSWAEKQNIFRRTIRKLSLPTPVSNIIRDYVRSMKALILNKDYTVSVWPNSSDLEDVDAAKVGEMLLRHMDQANDEEFLDEQEKTAMWVVIGGTAFDRTFPEMDRGDWSFDSNGDLIQTGEVVTENVPIFNVAVDPLGDKLNKKRAVGIKSVKDREWVEDNFKVLLATDEQEKASNYQKKLMKMVANVSPWKGSGLESLSELDDDDAVVFKEIEYKPDMQYPNGRYVATCCGQVLFAHNKMPIPIEGGKWEYSLTDYHYYYVPGRFWSDPGVNDLISPQNTINQIDQALEINRKSLGKTRILLGGEGGIQRMTKYGQHLMVLKYDAMLNPNPPQFDHGIPLPSQILDERNNHRQVAQDAAGDPKNVMRGQAPSAQASGVMVDTLREAAEQGHHPDVLRFFRSRKRTYRKRLIWAKNLYTEERIIKFGGKGESPKIIKFKGADLRDNTDVRLELSSGISSTKSGQVQMFMKLIEAGLFSTESELDPAFREELMRKMGLSGFEDKTNADVIRAQGENSVVANITEEDYEFAGFDTPRGIVEVQFIPGLFLSIADPEASPPDPSVPPEQQQPPEPIVLSEDPKFKFDNHMIHFGVHRDFIIGSEFKMLSPDAQETLIKHTDIHHHMMQAQADEAMQKQAKMQEMMEGNKPKR